MSYTQEDLAALKAAIASGAKRVRFGKEEVEYRSLAEMEAVLRLMRAELEGRSASPRRRLAVFGRGL